MNSSLFRCLSLFHLHVGLRPEGATVSVEKPTDWGGDDDDGGGGGGDCDGDDGGDGGGDDDADVFGLFMQFLDSSYAVGRVLRGAIQIRRCLQPT